MKFEVRYPTGAQHEVELSGTVAVLGRDPSCDLVLNDPKCSRRHAVIEAGSQGISIRDAGSANGIYVNGKKVERAALVDGDVVRLGEVILKVLPEEMPGTLVMAPEELHEVEAARRAATPPRTPVDIGEDRTAAVRPISPLPTNAPPPPSAPARPAAAPPPAVPPPAPPRPAAPPPPVAAAPPRPPAPPAERSRPDLRPSGPIPRPLTVTALALSWAIGVALYPAVGLGFAAHNGWQGLGAWLSFAGGAALAMLSALMAFGIWVRAPWARTLQIALAGLSLLTCAFTLAGAAILWYMLREETKIQFSGRQDLRFLAPREAELLERPSQEPLFAVAILTATALPYLIAALLFVVGRLTASTLLNPQGDRAAEAKVIERLQHMAAAERAFSSGTCGSYADLDGLLRPGDVIPNYATTGPAFVTPEFADPQASGYRFDLQVGDPAEPKDGCPRRSFRSFAYLASPVAGSGRFYLVGDDGQVHRADGRPATPSDPVE